MLDLPDEPRTGIVRLANARPPTRVPAAACIDWQVMCRMRRVSACMEAYQACVCTMLRMQAILSVPFDSYQL